MLILQRCVALFCLAAFLPGAAVADDAELRALIEKSIERSGGENQRSKTPAMTSKIKGSIVVTGATLPFTGEMAAQGGNQQRLTLSVTVDGQVYSYIRVLNREQGWQKINDSDLDLSADQLTELKASVYATWVSSLLPLKDTAFQLAPFGEREIGGRKAVGVTVTREGRRSITLFFDKETSRLIRTETMVRDEGTFQDVTEQTTFSNFKEFNGITYATKLSVSRNGAFHAEIDVEDYKPSEKLDETLFAKP